MKIRQEFTLDRPRPEVWAFFHDIPAVADCLPGAEYLGQKDDGSHSGRMSVKVGPFQANFEGAAEVRYDEAAHQAAMSGKGVDRRGASRGKMTMDVALHDEGGGTRVTVDADVQLSGSIAQFGRTGIVEEIAATLLSDFVANVEQALPASGATSPEPQAGAAGDAAAPQPGGRSGNRPVSGTRLLLISLRNWFRALMRAKQ